MTKKIVRGTRLEPVLNAQANAVATEHSLSFSEWNRNLIRREVQRQSGKRKGR